MTVAAAVAIGVGLGCSSEPSASGARVDLGTEPITSPPISEGGDRGGGMDHDGGVDRADGADPGSGTDTPPVACTGRGPGGIDPICMGGPCDTVSGICLQRCDTLLDPSAPIPLPCPPDEGCVRVGGSFSLCLRLCTSDESCPTLRTSPKPRCNSLSPSGGGPKYCLGAFP